MNKRLILKHKICRRYEEDIWGIFFRKQQRRDFFLKSLGLFIFRQHNKHLRFNFYRDRKTVNIVKSNLNDIRNLLFSNYLEVDNSELKDIKYSLINTNYLKTEYFLSFFFGIRISQLFFKNRFSNEKLNHILNTRFKVRKRRKKKARIYTLQDRLLKRKKLTSSNFSLELIPKTNLKRSSKNFKSLYHKRMIKVWNFRKFYGGLTNSQLKNLCLQSYRKRGDIVSNFIISLESRIDTVLYRTGMVSSIFEARQLISHKKILVNNETINIRSYRLGSSDILSLHPSVFEKLKKNLLQRIYNKSILFYNINYIETNYKLLSSIFVSELLVSKEVPYNFELSDKDINSILYYYY